MTLDLTIAKTLPPTLYYATVHSPWGLWTMAVAEGRLYACSYVASEHEAPSLPTLRTNYRPADVQQTSQMQRWIDAFIADTPEVVVPLALYGTSFQCRVWQALSKVKRGDTAHYAHLAEAIGSPRALRAVGTAIGRNPLAPFLACHRIVPRSGGLGHYYWGSQLKAQLLTHEGTIIF